MTSRAIPKAPELREQIGARAHPLQRHPRPGGVGQEIADVGTVRVPHKSPSPDTAPQVNGITAPVLDRGPLRTLSKYGATWDRSLASFGHYLVLVRVGVIASAGLGWSSDLW